MAKSSLCWMDSWQNRLGEIKEGWKLLNSRTHWTRTLLPASRGFFAFVSDCLHPTFASFEGSKQVENESFLPHLSLSKHTSPKLFLLRVRKELGRTQSSRGIFLPVSPNQTRVKLIGIESRKKVLFQQEVLSRPSSNQGWRWRKNTRNRHSINQSIARFSDLVKFNENCSARGNCCFRQWDSNGLCGEMRNWAEERNLRRLLGNR